ncbi:GNAT family N-acetyltransferase [bacterium]|nr:GNAT family N-acetyltransferase [bacterium]
MTPEIRTLALDDAIEVFHELNGYAFTPTPPLPDLEEYSERIRKRGGLTFLAVYEDGVPRTVGSARTMTQNLRGKIVTMKGIAQVASHPQARRKGYVRMMMNHFFELFHEENIPVSCLYPFKESFYEAMGYVTLLQTKKITFKPEPLAPVMKMDLPGEVELVRFGEGYPEFRAFLKRLQQTTHGMSLFAQTSTPELDDHSSWLAFARRDGETIGVMQYALKGEAMAQTLSAFDFLYSEPLGKFLLLDWIARHQDQAAKVELVLKPDIQGELLYTNVCPEQGTLFHAPMGRISVLPALSGLPVGEGEITIRITDPYAPWNEGVWRLRGDNGLLEVEPGDQAECELSIHGLTALVYGVYDPLEFQYRGWGNPNVDQAARLLQLFPPKSPFMLALF